MIETEPEGKYRMLKCRGKVCLRGEAERALSNYILT